MKFDAATIAALGQQLLGIAAIAAPGASATITTVVGLAGIASKLNDTLQAVRENDPEMWQKASAQFKDALSGFEASVARKAQG